MEVSFLKDAIDRVAEMAKPFTFEFAGRQFCSAELHEADGGAWKLEAKRNIAAYLGEQLADLVESGNVVVMI